MVRDTLPKFPPAAGGGNALSRLQRNGHLEGAGCFPSGWFSGVGGGVKGLYVTEDSWRGGVER